MQDCSPKQVGALSLAVIAEELLVANGVGLLFSGITIRHLLTQLQKNIAKVEVANGGIGQPIGKIVLSTGIVSASHKSGECGIKTALAF